MKEEVENVKKVKACSPGLGAVINCMLSLVNVVDDYGSRQMGLSGLGINDTTTTTTTTTTLSSPGIGSYTPYFGRRWKAKRYITAGMEIYGNYGQGYFTSRRDYDKIPLKSNYKEIDKILKKYQSIITSSSSSSSTGNADDAVIDGDSDWKGDLLIFLQSLNSIWDLSRNMHAIPQTDPPGDSSAVDWLLKQKGGSGMQHYNSSIRDPEWLQANGRCMDNIKDGISKIPDAGRGAFARRALTKGSLVAPVPLIHIPEKKTFTIYDKKKIITNKKDGNENFEIVADHENPIHHQLLLNYCFGHKER